MPIFHFIGDGALSPFRRAKLNAQLAPWGVELQEARWLYAVEAADQPEPKVMARLASLIDGELVPAAEMEDHALIVCPRAGTVSPWSSKATDIAQRCRLDFVLRLERGRLLRLSGPLSSAEAGYLLHDRMTEQLASDVGVLDRLFEHAEPRPLRRVDLLSHGLSALEAANAQWGLALSAEEIVYLEKAYRELGRDPTDAELMMFAQANSEHCRHKIFKASWTLDGSAQDASLFDMIRQSHAASPQGVLSAYSDNSAVIQGPDAVRYYPDPESRIYRELAEPTGIMIKVETHNHPTAISPHPGAATGSGGEIRDEAATGRGARPKAGLTGFSVSHLRIPGKERAWEGPESRPQRIASALDIMIEGPIGAASFNNEFGRPALAGYFRTFEQRDPRNPDLLRGYHKPIMIAGGMGAIRPAAIHKDRLSPGDRVVVLGGPAMLIGLGGGAASSVSSGTSAESLDYASVQRGNPEMQRRCQEVIDRCWALGDDNPIVSVHDVGAGGLSNAIPELLHDSQRGGRLDLRRIPTADTGLSPMEIWCNESQERYVLGISADRWSRFESLCKRERCPWAVLGVATEGEQLRLEDPLLDAATVDLPLSVLFGNPPGMHRDARSREGQGKALAADGVRLEDAISSVLRLPAVASKKFLITIGDRTVGGLVCRDQMVGPWQVPVADAAVTLADFTGYAGEAMAVGERSPLAVLDGPASGRMAVGEAITNIACADIAALGDIKLSANWMAAAGTEGEDAELYRTVQAVGAELCPALGIAIPVGKDSLSMQTVWHEGETARRMTAPLSLICSAFAPVVDVRRSLTPQLRMDESDTRLLLLDLGAGRDRLGGSALAQVQDELGDQVPDLDDPQRLKAFFELVQRFNRDGHLLAYHDRSDGGLIACLLEMAFAGRCGLDLVLPAGRAGIPFLFNEELGAVVQIRQDALDAFRATADDSGLSLVELGQPQAGDEVVIRQAGQLLYRAERNDLEAIWAETSHAIQALRDNPQCADEELAGLREDRRRLAPQLRFRPAEDIAAPYIATGARPEVAILREQGVNGQIEMAAAFDRAGFDAVDVHMTDLSHRRLDLDRFRGLVACGGFSYGDVLGAGRGWARAVLYRDELRQMFAQFFAATDRFALGVCNGCQALAAMAEIIPGSADWPLFVRNRSEQYEARLSMVEVMNSPSLLLREMSGSRLLVAVAHGEGLARYPGAPEAIGGRAALRYVDADGLPAEDYPINPSGSPGGVCGITNTDGRITLMMPHPERVFRSVQHSWHPPEWGEDGPWMRMFRNARVWVEQG